MSQPERWDCNDPLGGEIGSFQKINLWPCWLSGHQQIYVELERARLIKKLARIKEEQGLVAEAADLMQEVAVSIILNLSKVECLMKGRK